MFDILVKIFFKKYYVQVFLTKKKLTYIYPYEHLLDLDFVENDFYIASVSNPIFNTRKEWFDLCCDIATGSIVKNNH